MKDLSSKYIVVEGPIGVGKTSLANKLALEWDAELILENVDDNPFLSKFRTVTYGEPATITFDAIKCRRRKWVS